MNNSGYLVNTKHNKSRKIKENRTFNTINAILLIIFALICIIPFLNVIAKSFSSAGFTISLLPKGLTLYSYKTVLTEIAFYRAYAVSIGVTVLGTLLSVAVMFAAAYPLSKPDFPCRRGIMIFFIIVMLFSGGIVPNYLLVKTIGILDTPFALVLPSVVQVYHMILIKSYLESLPRELEESAKIDGATSLTILIKIILPLSGSMVATVCLFTGVVYWNNYFSALLYLPNNHTWYPLPMYILNLINSSGMNDILGDTKKVLHKENIQCATILLSLIPIILCYPMLLKHFTKGIMLGAVKG